MGILRTLFAIAVVFDHSVINLLIGGRNAVQLFYMISGFLISYVLVEKKAYPNIKDFYVNRYLRLYPIYLVIALLTLIAYSIGTPFGKANQFFEIYSSAPFLADILLVTSNLTLIFQDWVMFSGVENNNFTFTTSFSESEVKLWFGLLVPQAWTLGVELTFYTLAPFILFKKRVLITLLILSILLRVYLIYIGIGLNDPWSYRFFPTELALFLIGALAHQILLPMYKNILKGKQIEDFSKFATCLLIFITLTFSFIPLNQIFKTFALYSLFLLLMPFAFIFQTHRDWDKRVGDLSYPIYISHMLVIYILRYTVNKTNIFIIFNKISSLETQIIGFGAVTLSVCFAILLNRFVGTPIESLRNRFRNNDNRGCQTTMDAH